MSDNNNPYPVPLTKREQFVMAAMGGLSPLLLATAHGQHLTAKKIAVHAIQIADATMEALGIAEKITAPESTAQEIA